MRGGAALQTSSWAVPPPCIHEGPKWRIFCRLCSAREPRYRGISATRRCHVDNPVSTPRVPLGGRKTYSLGVVDCAIPRRVSARARMHEHSSVGGGHCGDEESRLTGVVEPSLKKMTALPIIMGWGRVQTQELSRRGASRSSAPGAAVLAFVGIMRGSL